MILEIISIDIILSMRFMVVVRLINNQFGRRNLTDGWKFQLSQAKKEILLEVGKESKKKH